MTGENKIFNEETNKKEDAKKLFFGVCQIFL